MKVILSKCKHIYIIIIFSLFHVSRNFFHFFQQVILFVKQLAHLIQHRNDSFKTFSTTNINLFDFYVCQKYRVEQCTALATGNFRMLFLRDCIFETSKCHLCKNSNNHATNRKCDFFLWMLIMKRLSLKEKKTGWFWRLAFCDCPLT